MQALFIFSLPRSGSTLLQRILATHGEIATASEPWFLLPYFYTLRAEGVYSVYSHRHMVQALEDFWQRFPNGKEDYLAELKDFVLRLYTKAAGRDVRYFLDKTPRYHLIVEDIIHTFPEGKFVFLWRHPLAVAASIIETWSPDLDWNLYRYKVDLYEGLGNLISAYEKHRTNVHTLCYEKLITNPEEECNKLFNFLSLTFSPETLKNFANVNLNGIMGDGTGVKKYNTLADEPLEKWKKILSNPLRKAWCRRYLRWIGKDRLAVMGYDMDQILGELKAIPSSRQKLGPDPLRMIYGIASCLLSPNMIKESLGLLPEWHRVHTYM